MSVCSWRKVKLIKPRWWNPNVKLQRYLIQNCTFFHRESWSQRKIKCKMLYKFNMTTYDRDNHLTKLRRQFEQGWLLYRWKHTHWMCGMVSPRPCLSTGLEGYPASTYLSYMHTHSCQSGPRSTPLTCLHISPLFIYNHPSAGSHDNGNPWVK